MDTMISLFIYLIENYKMSNINHFDAEIKNLILNFASIGKQKRKKKKHLSLVVLLLIFFLIYEIYFIFFLYFYMQLNMN
jgi:hypothetical protein